MCREGAKVLFCGLLLWYCLPAGLIACMAWAAMRQEKQTAQSKRGSIRESRQKYHIAA